MFPQDRKVLLQPVTIEYTSRGKRVKKTLDNSWAARRFYAHKLRESKRPRFIQQPARKNQQKKLAPSGRFADTRGVRLQ